MTQTLENAVRQESKGILGYASIMVHAEPGESSTDRVRVAARLAREAGAHLIGIAAATVDPGLLADPMGGYLSGDWVVLLREQIEKDLKAAEQAFRRDAADAEDVEWRAIYDFPERALAREARAADLVVVGPRSKGDGLRPDVGDLVMRSGRPVLVAPAGRVQLAARSIVVAWKDTREARRAVADALPLLAGAEEVVVQAVCDDDTFEAAVFQTNDVAAALRRHGVAARANASLAPAEGVSHEIERVSQLNGADLIVAGAYGHSRAAEWAFGGVTDDLIHHPQRFVLLSH